jgi:TPR repeat protein
MASLGSDPRFCFSFWGLTLVFSVALAPPALAQQYKPTPVDQCFSFSHLRFGPGGNNTQPLTHELAAKGAEARGLCEQAVKDRPKEGRLYATLARLRAIGGDRPGALEAARAGAALGATEARVLLGVMLAEGQAVKRDYAAAREQFRLAARDDSPFAQFNLGAILANGWGVEVDEGDAAAAFLRAAKNGDPLSMQIAGQRYDKASAEQWFRKAAETMTTEGVREPLRIADIGRAALDVAPLLAWYMAKARAGEPWAQGYLGALYEAGQWVKQDDAQAALWYRQAGESGHLFAQWRMAAFYREGRGGLPQDKAESNRWSMMWQVKRCDDHERAGVSANACDRFAADGFDPQRAAPGVDSFCMRHFVERAIVACRAAVNASPGTVRYRTQLARSLAHTGRIDEARREASSAAAAGSTAAMILLGVMSERGLGVAKDPAAALAWYRKAAEAGDERGVQMVLASIQKGLGVAKDSPEAKALSDAMWRRMEAAANARGPVTIAQRAAAGDVRSQFNLAAQLEQEKNYEEALKWYTRAAAQGFGLAELNVAQMYEKGIGVKQDTAEARKRYRKLADNGDGEARWRAARLALGANDYDEALKLFNRSIRDDDYRAILDVGLMYEQGRGVKKDMSRAVELYERVGERSYWASAKLGTLYLQGDGIPQDYAKARARLQRAAGGGNAAARNNLGVMYERGLGVGVDPATAAELYFGALAGDNLQARGNLERLYAEGRGAPAGAARVAWYRRGADADIAAAQYQLGRMYAKGDGVPRNDEAAAQWLMKAAQQGHPEARKEAGELLYALGRDMEAAALGHEGAARRLAVKLAASGRPDAAAELNRYLADARARTPPPPVYPDGIAQDPGADQSREIAVRVGGVGDMQANAMNAATADPYDIIRWYPANEFKR